MQHTNNYPDTFKHMIMTRLGYFYVPPHHLQVVCSDGVFHSYLETGYHRPSLWKMSYPQLIKLGTRKKWFKLKQLRGADGGSFEAKVLVKYKFDPRVIEWDEVRAKLSVASEDIIEKMVMEELENGMRKAFCDYKAHTIQQGIVRSNLQRRCKHILIGRLNHLGILVGNVMITTIVAPEVVETRSSDAVSRMMMAQQLEGLSQEQMMLMMGAQMPDILSKLELSLDLKNSDDLKSSLKKLTERLAMMERHNGTGYQNGITLNGSHDDTIMTDHATLH